MQRTRARAGAEETASGRASQTMVGPHGPDVRQAGRLHGGPRRPHRTTNHGCGGNIDGDRANDAKQNGELRGDVREDTTLHESQSAKRDDKVRRLEARFEERARGNGGAPDNMQKEKGADTKSGAAWRPVRIILGFEQSMPRHEVVNRARAFRGGLAAGRGWMVP